MDKAPENIQASERRSQLGEFWHYFRENRGAVIGLFFFLGVCLVAVFADLLAPHGPTVQYRDALLNPPVWQEGGSWNFILGTDAVGRDILSRLIHGSRYSLFVGCIVVSISLVVGVMIGLLSGYVGGIVDGSAAAHRSPTAGGRRVRARPSRLAERRPPWLSRWGV